MKQVLNGSVSLRVKMKLFVGSKSSFSFQSIARSRFQPTACTLSTWWGWKHKTRQHKGSSPCQQPGCPQMRFNMLLAWKVTCYREHVLCCCCFTVYEGDLNVGAVGVFFRNLMLRLTFETAEMWCLAASGLAGGVAAPKHSVGNELWYLIPPPQCKFNERDMTGLKTNLTENSASVTVARNS